MADKELFKIIKNEEGKLMILFERKKNSSSVKNVYKRLRLGASQEFNKSIMNELEDLLYEGYITEEDLIDDVYDIIEDCKINIRRMMNYDSL